MSRSASKDAENSLPGGGRTTVQNFPTATMGNTKRRRFHDLPSILPGTGAVAASSSREALTIYEKLELEKKRTSSNSHHRPPTLSSFISPSKSTPQTVGSSSRHPKILSSPVIEVSEEEYEIKAILKDEVRRVNGKMERFYLIEWEGDWDSSVNPSWEPEENFHEEARKEYLRGKRLRRLELDSADEEEYGEIGDENESGRGKGKEIWTSRIYEGMVDEAREDEYGKYEREESDPDTLFVTEMSPEDNYNYAEKGKGVDRTLHGPFFDRVRYESNEGPWPGFDMEG